MNKFFAGAFLGFIFGVFVIELANNAAKRSEEESEKDLSLNKEKGTMATAH